MRAEFQVILVGFIRNEDKFLILQRSDSKIWQFVSGGGEDNETPKEAAIREFYEEAGIKVENVTQLDAMNTIPSYIYKEHRDKKELFVVPEYAFAVELKDENIYLSEEHDKFEFLTYEACFEKLKYDSNRTAMYETRERLRRNVL